MQPTKEIQRHLTHAVRDPAPAKVSDLAVEVEVTRAMEVPEL
jgi:hypothetical protein